MNISNKNNKFSTKDIVIIGMLSAICTISILIQIPYGNGALVHLGTAAVFTSAILFGGTKGGIAGAIGATFYDILFGMGPYTIWSFLIKGLCGYVVGSVSNSNILSKHKLIANILGCVFGAILTLLGYILAWTVVQGSFAAALLNIPSSLISSGVGIVVALPLSAALSIPLKKAGFYKK